MGRMGCPVDGGHVTHVAPIVVTLMGVLGFHPGCRGECARVDFTGDVRVGHLTYREGPDAMQLEFSVANGREEDVYM